MRVLVVEDDPDIQAAVEQGLRQAGFAVDAVGSILDAEVNCSVNAYDCLVFDRLLPDGDSLDTVGKFRQKGDATPVLFLTARDAVDDRVAGFEAGGDDYLVKPFALSELIVRVRALCRRSHVAAPAQIVLGDLVIDTARAEVRRAGVSLPLTTKERCILQRLAYAEGTTVSRSDLIEHCWDETHDPMSNVVDVHVASLRRKLGDPNPVVTVRGVGFRLDGGVGE